MLECTRAAIQAAALTVSCALAVHCSTTPWTSTTEYIFTSTTPSTTSSPTSTEEFLGETTTVFFTTTTYPSTTVTSSTTSFTTTTQFETRTQSETSSSLAFTTTSDPSTTTSHPTTTTSHPVTTTTNADNTTIIPSITTSPDVPNDTCNNSPCRNGGLCRTSLKGYTCYCPSGFSGELCDTEKDEQRKVPVSVLAGALVGCIVLFSAILIVVVCIARRKMAKARAYSGSSNPTSVKDSKQPAPDTMWVQDEPLRLYEPMADPEMGSKTQTEGSNYADLQTIRQEDTYDQLNAAPQYLQMGQIGPQLSQELKTPGEDRSSTYYVNQL